MRAISLATSVLFRNSLPVLIPLLDFLILPETAGHFPLVPQDKSPIR
jgi:hypothetical protein